MTKMHTTRKNRIMRKARTRSKQAPQSTTQLNNQSTIRSVASQVRVDNIFDFVVARNKQLDEIALSLDAPAKIQVRVQQLALCKLLVNVHKKDLFILVTAFTQLGEAYLRANYFEQALDHLTTALKLNGSLFSQVADTKQYHSQILTLLGNCYMEAGNFKDALSLLDKSLKMNKQIMGDNDSSNA